MMQRQLNIGSYKEIMLIRHGTTAANISGKYTGRSDYPLSQEGKAQVLELKYKLRSQTETGWFDDSSQATIVCSPMLRCRQTADLLWTDSLISYEPRFIETDFGVWEGLTYNQLKNDYLYKEWLKAAPLNKPAPPEGESGAAMFKRIKEGWNDYLQAGSAKINERLAIVAHGGVIMYLMTEITGSEDEFYNWQLPTASAFILTREGITNVNAADR